MIMDVYSLADNMILSKMGESIRRQNLPVMSLHQWIIESCHEVRRSIMKEDNYEKIDCNY